MPNLFVVGQILEHTCISVRRKKATLLACRLIRSLKIIGTDSEHPGTFEFLLVY